jgi:WD40 repeat protein
VVACLQRGHTGEVRAVALSPSGRLCATAGDDRTVRLWEAGSGYLLRTLRGHHDPITAVVFLSSPSVASAAASATATAASGRGPASPASGPHLPLAMEERLLVSASLDFTARVWEARSGRLVRTLVGHTDGVIALGHAPGRGLLATASLDGTVRIWEVGSFSCVQALRPKVEDLTAAALSPDGMFCAVGSSDGFVHVFHPLSGELLSMLGGWLCPPMAAWSLLRART